MSRDDLLESVDPRTDLLRSAWAQVPRRRRVQTWLAVALVVTVVAGWIGAAHLRAWLHERDLRDRVSLSATMEVSAASTLLSGGRVDYYLVVRNVGPGQVRISGLALKDTRLRIVARDPISLLLLPGTSVEVPLSIRLDCVPLLGNGPGTLGGTISATPESGRKRSVATALTQTSLVTDVADTLCRALPETHDKELSGLVT